MRKAKPKPRTPPFQPVPRVGHDLPEPERLAAQFLALDRARYNLAVASEEFEREWRVYGDYKQAFEPHAFRDAHALSAIASGRSAYQPKQCAVCWRLRADERHGALKRHEFVQCGRSFREAGKRLCWECGLPEGAKPHQAAARKGSDE